MPRNSQTLIWGIHPVTEALINMPQMVNEIIVQKSARSEKISNIVELAHKNNIKVSKCSKINIPDEDHANHQGVVAGLKEFKYSKLDDILNQDPQPELVVALDSIQDPHNLGAIIRSAAAAGCGGILIPKDRSAAISGTVAKVAAGALSHVKIGQVTNLANSLKKLKDHGYWIYGADGHTDTSIFETSFSEKCCIVIGSEGKGLRSLVKKNCDHLVKIPLSAGVESLNASVAAGIIIFEIVRQQENY